MIISKGKTFPTIEATGGSTHKHITVDNIPPHDHFTLASSHYRDRVTGVVDSNTTPSVFGTVV